jgi:diguanylate cyclase (GGDEF)-like protein
VQQSPAWHRLAAIALGLVCLLAAQSPAAQAEAPPLQIRIYDAGPSPPDRDEILSGSYDNNFSVAEPGELRIGPPGRTFWLLLEARMPAPSARDLTEGHWQLVLNRVAVESLELFIGDDGRWSRHADGFFRPGAQALTLGAGFLFRLPRTDGDALRMYLRVVSDVRVNLEPRLEREVQALARDRSLSNMFAAIYTALLVLLAINLILYAALRDATYLAFVGWSASVFLLVLAANGHLYGIPGLGWIGWWGALGVYAFAFLSAAASVWFFRTFTGFGSLRPRFDRMLLGYGWVMLALAALCLLNLRGWLPGVQLAANLAVALTALLLAIAAVVAWRAGSASARPFFWVWSLLTLFVLLRVAVGFDVAPLGAIGLYGYQIAASLAAFLFSIALAERVIEFRRQRDEAKQMQAHFDASLRREQARRSFVEGVREVLARSSGGDAEWVALRRLLADLVPLIPHQGSAVVVQGHDGKDYMFCEPAGQKEHFARLLRLRADALRGICRSRMPIAVKFDDSGDGNGAPRTGTFAVVPLPLSRSGWGALILERGEFDDFGTDELRTAHEFARLALETAQEVISQVSLQREAESDPLTGALNRRAGDAALESALKNAIAQRLPLAVLFIDIDHFKAVNDMHGHQVGDQCLVAVAETIASQLTPGDSLSRYGGEEFQVVLPGRTLAQARDLAERIRVAVRQGRIDCNGLRLTLTVSIGVAQRQAEDGTIQTLQERADKALYKAKANGRNCVATLAPTDLGSQGLPGYF